MRFQLDATPEELSEKAPQLLDALAHRLGGDAGAALHKALGALPRKEKPLKHRALQDLADMTSEAYKLQVKAMLAEIGEVIDESLEEKIEKALYIGPRGGRWADSDHTIPYDDSQHAPKKFTKQEDHDDGHTLHYEHHDGSKQKFEIRTGKQFQVKGRDDQKVTFTIGEVKNGKAKIHQGEGTEGNGKWMDVNSVRHFAHDLQGVVHGPKSDDPHISAVLGGKSKHLGKGDDGVAHKVGDKVVKHSTTVPFHPMNPGHLTPAEAATRMEHQTSVIHTLRKLGIPGIPEVRGVHHGDKFYQIQDHLDVDAKLSQEQLDQAYETVHKMHEKGWSMNDQIQVGVDKDGKVWHFDTGKASLLPDPGGSGALNRRQNAIDDDIQQIKALYQQHGGKFERIGGDTKQRWKDFVNDHMRLTKMGGSPLTYVMTREKIDSGYKAMRATLEKEGEEADSIEFDILDWDYQDAISFLNDGRGDSKIDDEKYVEALKRRGLEKPLVTKEEKSLAKALFIGPRGGRWADSDHTIPYEEGKAKRPKKAKGRHLFHSTSHHAMDKIKEHGLHPSGSEHSSQTFGGSYQGHSKGKLFLSEHHKAAREWHHKVQANLENEHDDQSKHTPVMLRVKGKGLRTHEDEAGNKDVEGSRYAKRAIHQDDLEYYHPKKGWRPAHTWGDDTGTDHASDAEGQSVAAHTGGGYQPPDEHHAHAHSEETTQHREGQEAKRQEFLDAKEAERKAAIKEKVDAKAKEEAHWLNPEYRKRKVQELLAHPGGVDPIRGTKMPALNRTWQEKLKVDAKGEPLKGYPFESAGEAEEGPKETAKEPQSTKDFAKGLEEKYGLKLSLTGHRDVLTIHKIVVPEEERGKGTGAKAMKEILAHADEHGKMITLTPSTDFGASSKARLVKFYKQFGFVENKGRNKDYEVSEAMYRPQAAEKSLSREGSRYITESELVDAKTAENINGLRSMERRAYERVKAALMTMGYGPLDFDDQAGRLYGLSTNELIDLVRESRATD